jgi:hypothetical protein
MIKQARKHVPKQVSMHVHVPKMVQKNKIDRFINFLLATLQVVFKFENLSNFLGELTLEKI